MKGNGKEMIYLMTHSTGMNEGNLLFNDALNTFYLWLTPVVENWLEQKKKLLKGFIVKD